VPTDRRRCGVFALGQRALVDGADRGCQRCASSLGDVQGRCRRWIAGHRRCTLMCNRPIVGVQRCAKFERRAFRLGRPRLVALLDDPEQPDESAKEQAHPNEATD